MLERPVGNPPRDLTTMPGRDTKIAFQGVFVRHREGCAVEQLPPRPAAADAAGVCGCDPSYYGVVYDGIRRKHVKTRRFPKVLAARAARNDLNAKVTAGPLPARGGPVRLREARERFNQAAKDGIAMNKWGRRYKRRAWEDMESALRHLPEYLLRRGVTDLNRADIQRLLDDLHAKGLSGSRIRSVVNAIRSLYAWAAARELADHDPAARVHLPAMDATPRDLIDAFLVERTREVRAE